MSEAVEKQELHLPIEEAGQNAVELLATHSGLSRQQIKQAMQKGAVWLGRGKRVRPLRRAKRPLQPGEELHLYYDAAVLAEVPPAPQLVADEGDYSIWYKPYGLRSQGSRWGDHCAINRWLELNLTPQRPAFIVHRLDRATTGLILIAHTKTAAAALSAMFRERGVEKRYRAVVHGAFPEGEGLRLDTELDERPALSHARRLAYDAQHDRSLLEVDIATGRKHQIRRHLAGAGFPVVGDRLYGREGDEEDLQLSAVELRFRCPLSGEARHYRLQAGDPACPIASLD